ncbi:MAG: hypothetical protein JXO22_02230 [Phycisphaerae bacterium]|nr:hypothetical protein [Phycisphaerae bacterium]
MTPLLGQECTEGAKDHRRKRAPGGRPQILRWNQVSERSRLGRLGYLARDQVVAHGAELRIAQRPDLNIFETRSGAVDGLAEVAAGTEHANKPVVL